MAITLNRAERTKRALRGLVLLAFVALLLLAGPVAAQVGPDEVVIHYVQSVYAPWEGLRLFVGPIWPDRSHCRAYSLLAGSVRGKISAPTFVAYARITDSSVIDMDLPDLRVDGDQALVRIRFVTVQHWEQLAFRFPTRYIRIESYRLMRETDEGWRIILTEEALQAIRDTAHKYPLGGERGRPAIPPTVCEAVPIPTPRPTQGP